MFNRIDRITELYSLFLGKALLVAIVLSCVAFAPDTGWAGQESVDARLLKIFQDVDDRNRTHEKKAKRVLEGLEQIKAEVEAQEKELNALPSNLSENERAQRETVISAKMINGYSQLYNRLGKHLDDRAALVGKNLEDLGRVLKQIQRSGRSAGGAKELQARIAKNVAMGRNLKGALTELRSWAKNDPRLKSKSASLQRLMKTLDRKVSLTKARLAVQGRSALAGYGNRTADTLNAALDRLGDQYAEIMAEKAALRTVRDELTIAIEIGRLRVTERIARKTIPSGPGGTSLPPLLSIVKYTEKIGALNDRIILETNRELSEGASGGAVMGASRDNFVNF